ncbi:MAG: sulfurtransferase [Gammaproteobacteria bacterium]|nr:sulfurtransferase [Gammaproteobacteria bacterium]
MLIKKWSQIIISLVFVVGNVVSASDLVDVQWLLEHNTTSKIIDLRDPQLFEVGHIPNAINIPFTKFNRIKENISGFVIPPMEFKKLMSFYGVSQDDRVILYSDWSFLESMRVYWIFDFYGHQYKKVLDGGIQQWVEDGQMLSFEAVKPSKSDYSVEINTQIMTTKFRAFMASKNPNYVIVDGRDHQQYAGLTSYGARKGHIPTAINIPWTELLNDRGYADKYERIDSPATLGRVSLLKEKFSGLPENKKVILYCNSGQEASVIYFALKELGIESSVFDGSWVEWSNDKNLPIE